jgi:hypothetical protein
MSTENCTGVEVTFAAILAAQECGDFEAIGAAEKGGSAWSDYVALYISNYAYNEFTLAPLTNSQSAMLRWQVLEQAALLPERLYGAYSKTGQSRARVSE